MLRPLVDYFLNIANAPVWLGALALLAFLGWIAVGLMSRLNDAARAERQPLDAADTDLIERALAVNEEGLSLALDGIQPAGAEPRSMLRAALTNYLKSGESSGRRVATLMAAGHANEAQGLAAEIARSVQRKGESARARAARAWVDAGAVAYVSDMRAATAACERARELGVTNVVALAWMGCLYLSRGRLGEAEAAMRAAEAGLGPRDHWSRAVLLGNLGSVAAKRGDREQARELYARALELYSRLGSEAQAFVRYIRDNIAKLDGG